MTSLLYFLQVSIVFLCPIFFGWVVLRRVAREHDWFVLLPGSVVLGNVALMALMNELRYWLEMSIASWFAYKLLLGARRRAARPHAAAAVHAPVCRRFSAQILDAPSRSLDL
jgi:hypothetical protein